MEINSNWFFRWFLSFKGEGIERMKTKKQQDGKVFHWMIRSVPKINTLKVKKMNSKEDLYSFETSSL